MGVIEEKESEGQDEMGGGCSDLWGFDLPRVEAQAWCPLLAAGEQRKQS